jgi:hypothetical protein
LAEVIDKAKKQASLPAKDEAPAKKSKKGATSTTANTSPKSALAIKKMPRITVNRMTLNLDDEVLKMIAGFQDLCILWPSPEIRFLQLFSIFLNNNQYLNLKSYSPS